MDARLNPGKRPGLDTYLGISSGGQGQPGPRPGHRDKEGRPQGIRLLKKRCGGGKERELGGSQRRALGAVLGSSRGQRAPSSQALTPPRAAFASWAGPRSPASGMDSGPEETDAHLPRPVFHSGAPINFLEPPPLSPAAAVQSGCISHDKTLLKAPVTGPNQSFEI